MGHVLHYSEEKGDFSGAKLRAISMRHPRKWIVAGWHDLTTAPAISLMYGATFSMIGLLLISALLETPHLVLMLMAGFLLLGPFLAAGLYNISRHIEQGDKINLRHAIEIWHYRPQAIAMFAALLGIIMIAWVKFATILFALSFSNPLLVMKYDSFLQSLFFSADGLVFLTLFFVVGGALAVFVFAISAVAIPMILDKETDCVSAAATSFKAVMKNKGPMALWAGLIVAYTFVGLITFCLGLIITMPLIGHATWHAYRDLVEQ